MDMGASFREQVGLIFSNDLQTKCYILKYNAKNYTKTSLSFLRNKRTLDRNDQILMKYRKSEENGQPMWEL